MVELAGIGSAGHGGSFWQLLTGATPVAPLPPKSGHANSINTVISTWTVRLGLFFLSTVIQKSVVGVHSLLKYYFLVLLDTFILHISRCLAFYLHSGLLLFWKILYNGRQAISIVSDAMSCTIFWKQSQYLILLSGI